MAKNKYTQQALGKIDNQSKLQGQSTSPVSINSSKSQANQETFVFNKTNYFYFLLGIGIVALGFILMSGGGSDDKTVFNPAVMDTRRLIIAPITVLIGFITVGVSIFINTDKKK